MGANEEGPHCTVVVFTGGGKGKTTAAVGLACRSVGHGGRAVLVYFTGPTRPRLGEVVATEVLGPKLEMIAIHSQAADTGFLEQFDESVPTVEAALQRAGEILSQGDCSLLVLDDINPLLNEGAVHESTIKELIALAPETTTIVLTGRSAPQWALDLASIATDFAEVEHPARVGIRPRKGIDF